MPLVDVFLLSERAHAGVAIDGMWSIPDMVEVNDHAVPHISVNTRVHHTIIQFIFFESITAVQTPQMV